VKQWKNLWLPSNMLAVLDNITSHWWVQEMLWLANYKIVLWQAMSACRLETGGHKGLCYSINKMHVMGSCGGPNQP
jgi:hypothetical protein